MEKGTLIVFKTQKGFAVKIAYQKPDGKSGELPAPAFQPKDDTYNNTACTFKRESGKLLQLIAHDGTELIGLPAYSSRQDKQQYVGGASDSFSPNDTFLPKDTREALDRLQSPDNFSLKLNKAARADKEKGKFHFFKRERKGENYEIKAEYGSVDFQQLVGRELSNAERLLSKSGVKSFDLQTDWRMVQGLGTESVYETSLTLHHVYGVPYIPASSLKGMVRSWIITQVFGTPQSAGEEKDFPLANAEFRALTQSKEFCSLFGCPSEVRPIKFANGKPTFKKDKNGKITTSYEEEKPVPVALKDVEGKGVSHKGKLIFFDAFPIAQPSIEVDVMNPHYVPYYSDKTAQTPPADYHNPIPVHFLTVAGTRFRFIIGSSDPANLNVTIEGKTIYDWLTAALTSHGIGAKTAVGYGYMKNV